ncbi:MAG: hypothetical protein AAF518_28200 [Spirochaetota bacterium]
MSTDNDPFASLDEAPAGDDPFASMDEPTYGDDPFADLGSMEEDRIEGFEGPEKRYNNYHPDLTTGLESFQRYVVELAQVAPAKRIGLHIGDAVEINFSKDAKGNEILDTIRKQNKKNNFGNIKIPNTDIEFINYSYCPNCSTIYNFKELLQYYDKPKPNDKFKDQNEQLRFDTSVHCKVCATIFLPTLVIVDENPLSEVQFLCRMQTIEAIESFFYKKRRKRVLSRNPDNLVEIEEKKYVLNDVLLKDLAAKPALIMNLLQYSPIDFRLRMIEGTNVEAKDYLFGPVRHYPA